MFSFKDSVSRWLPVLFWCLLIFVLSSLPTMETSKIYWWDFVIKKTAHVIEYGILYFLVFKAVEGFKAKSQKSPASPRRSRGRANVKATTQKAKFNIIIPFLFCFFYSITDEYHQSFVPGRTATLRDIGFDTLGALAAFLKLQKNYG